MDNDQPDRVAWADHAAWIRAMPLWQRISRAALLLVAMGVMISVLAVPRGYIYYHFGLLAALLYGAVVMASIIGIVISVPRR